MSKFVRKSFTYEIQADDTAEAISATSLGCNDFTIQSDVNNSNPIYVGDSAVNSDGYPLEASWTISSSSPANLADMYVMGKDGEKVRVFYTQSLIG